MTNERDMNNVDELVSATYHELADDRTPEHLDRAVLEMAAGKSPRNSAGSFWLSAWMKPVAWAATIALSLAIVLEFTEVQNDAGRMGSTPPAVESTQDEFSPQDAQALGRAERRADSQAGPAVAEEPAPVATSTLKSRAQEAEISTVAASAPGSNVPAAKKQLVQEDARHDTDSPARLREEKSAPMPSSNFAASMPETDPVHLEEVVVGQSADMAISAPGCTPAARLAAASWFACIEELRAAGAAAGAEREYAAFADEFPEEFADIEANK